MCLVSLIFINIFFYLGMKCEEIGNPSRIIGGSYCDLRYPEINYKFMVSLRTFNDLDFYEHFCGGTLITEYWILTAGHCLKPETMYAVEAHRIDEIEYTGFTTEIVKGIVHPKFDNNTNNHDIAILLLASPICKSSKVDYVFLPIFKKPILDLTQKLIKDKCSRLTVMGWGQTTKDEQGKWFPVKLECLDLNLIDLDECRKIHENHKMNKTVYEDNICTEASSSVDFWKGDSGGPLLCGNVQYGIISWGYGAHGYPSVYTRVDKYLDFIRSVVCRAAGA